MAEQFHFDPDSYLDVIRCEVADYDRLQEVVAQAAGEVRAALILDLGTGTGETLRHVTQHHPDAQIVGIDESERMLAAARRLVPNADLRVARLQDELPEGAFDLVVSSLAVHHLDAQEKRDLFRCVAAQLAPGGRLVLGDVVIPDDPADALIPLDAGYDQPSRADDQLQWLTDAGLAPELRWNRRDLAVLIGDKPPG